MSRFLGPFLLVLIFGLALLALRGGETTSTAAAAAEAPRYTLHGAQWRSFDAAGALRFDGHAERIDYFDDESAQLSGFELRLLGASGSPWVADAPSGRSQPEQPHRLTLSGGVDGHGRWPDGEDLQFHTPELDLDLDRRQLETAAVVRLESATRRASARGLRVDGEQQRVTLMHEVEMHYVPR